MGPSRAADSAGAVRRWSLNELRATRSSSPLVETLRARASRLSEALSLQRAALPADCAHLQSASQKLSSCLSSFESASPHAAISNLDRTLRACVEGLRDAPEPERLHPASQLLLSSGFASLISSRVVLWRIDQLDGPRAPPLPSSTDGWNPTDVPAAEQATGPDVFGQAPHLSDLVFAAVDDTRARVPVLHPELRGPCLSSRAAPVAGAGGHHPSPAPAGWRCLHLRHLCQRGLPDRRPRGRRAVRAVRAARGAQERAGRARVPGRGGVDRRAARYSAPLRHPGRLGTHRGAGSRWRMAGGRGRPGRAIPVHHPPGPGEGPRRGLVAVLARARGTARGARRRPRPRRPARALPGGQPQPRRAARPGRARCLFLRCHGRPDRCLATPLVMRRSCTMSIHAAVRRCTARASRRPVAYFSYPASLF
eukprot:scaffold12492_cov98-Isochrysis_galbana.AAC.7